MLEISTSGLMSGDGKRSGALQSTATAPVLDFTNLIAFPKLHVSAKSQAATARV